MKKKATRAPQERGKITRQNLLLAAIEALVDDHVYGLRFSNIAKIAKVPQPLMDYHFPSLEALLIEMVSYQLERLKVASLEAIQKNASKPRKALEAYIRAPFEMAGKDRGFRAVWSSYYHLATVNKSFADFNRGVRKMGRERTMALISGVVGDENLKNSGDARRLGDAASYIQGLITGCGFMAAAETDGDFKEMADLAVKAAFQLLEANFPSRS